jgi:hypothetical protein
MRHLPGYTVPVKRKEEAGLLRQDALQKPGPHRAGVRQKRFKRVAMRCEKTAQNYASFVALALGIIWVKSVHRA